MTYFKIINSIQDCQAVLSLRIGEVPLEKLKQKGITSIMLYDNIENGIKKFYEWFINYYKPTEN